MRADGATATERRAGQRCHECAPVRPDAAAAGEERTMSSGADVMVSVVVGCCAYLTMHTRHKWSQTRYNNKIQKHPRAELKQPKLMKRHVPDEGPALRLAKNKVN